jgi:hypothetical protein
VLVDLTEDDEDVDKGASENSAAKCGRAQDQKPEESDLIFGVRCRSV